MSPKTILTRDFARHYLEMVAVMFLGMIALGLSAGWALEAVGSSWAQLRDEAPAAALGLMAITMTAPMSAWMYRMGHGWRLNLEMAASMIVPTLGAMGALAVGAADDLGVLLAVEHAVMLASMFLVMAVRPEAYSKPHHHEAVPA